jgi:hypothetical protein
MLSYDGSTLTIKGNMTATTGTIGGWSINGTSIYRTSGKTAYLHNAVENDEYSPYAIYIG